jgi:predicted MFS family arabinose efflux permease
MVGFAFADSSIVVLALPDLLRQFRPSVSDASWVITSYNLVLGAAVLVVAFLKRGLAPRRVCILGLTLFLSSSLACGSAGGIWELVAWRCVQGLGGGLLLLSTLPIVRSLAVTPTQATRLWVGAGAVGSVTGPAAGGFLTEFLSWRFIFFAQVPFALLAILAAKRVPAESTTSFTLDAETDARDRARRLQGNLGLAFASAALVGALFLGVLLLIDAWKMRPLAAAAIVSAYPIAAVLVQPAARGASGRRMGLGALLLGAGLAGMAIVPAGDSGWAIASLSLAGLGTGLALPGLTRSALGEGGGLRSAVWTVSARQAGLIAGLLILTPLLSADITSSVNQVQTQTTTSFVNASLPLPIKVAIGAQVAPLSDRPLDLLPRLVALLRESPDPDARTLGKQMDSLIRKRLTGAFRRSFWIATLLAALVLPVLALNAATRGLSTRRQRDLEAGASMLSDPSE